MTLWRAFCAAAVILCANLAIAQQTDAPTLQGGPSDWSDHAVVYTRNGALEDVMRVSTDPRYVRQTMQHDSKILHQMKLASDASFSNDPAPPPDVPVHGKNKGSKVDWSVSLGSNGGMATGESPSIFTYNYTSPNCTKDFIVYTINATPSSSQANLIGFNNLYSNSAGTGFCSGTGPSVLFSYEIGSSGSALSPVLSLDGTRVAWIEQRLGSPGTAPSAYLHVTIWASGQGTSATAPTAPNGTFSNGACTTAGTSCDFALAYTASTYSGCSTAYTATNTHSDLYVDYPNDAGYISANNGLLYHVKNLFSTTASPSVDFCIPVNTALETANAGAMSAPIYDPLHTTVYVTDSEKLYAFTVGASSFTAAGTYSFGNASSLYNYPTASGLMLDPFNSYLYVFSSYDVDGKTSVTQVSAPSLSSGTEVPLGPKTTNTLPYLFYGAFDNNYINNGSKSASSTLYSCGADSTNNAAQDLFAISFNASTGVVNTTPAMSANKNINSGGTSSGVCSPLMEFYDGTNDRLFVGMGQPGSTSGANLVSMWTINSQLTSSTATPTATAVNYYGGTSGFSADNNDNTVSQAENVYFSTQQGSYTWTNVTGSYNVEGISTTGTTYASTGFDHDGYTYSSNLLGLNINWSGNFFTVGPANQNDVWEGPLTLSSANGNFPSGSYSTLALLGGGVNGNQTNQNIVVTYTDNSTTTFTQSISDWVIPPTAGLYSNETLVVDMAYRDYDNGTTQIVTGYTINIYGYTFALNSGKTLKSIALPNNNDVGIVAIALGATTGSGFNAVKLTQVGLQ